MPDKTLDEKYPVYVIEWRSRRNRNTSVVTHDLDLAVKEFNRLIDLRYESVTIYEWLNCKVVREINRKNPMNTD